jgi:YbbR domain-containing protein
MCLSLVLALMLYLYVEIQTSRPTKKDFHADLRVDVPANVSYSLEAPVTVTVSGPQAEIDTLERDPSLLVATLNARGLSQALDLLRQGNKPVTQVIPVVVKNPPGMDDLTFEVGNYGRVALDLELKKRVYREVEIRSAVDPRREVPFDQRSKVQVEPAGVWLDGPASHVAIATPIVEVDFENLSRPDDLSVKVVNDNGEVEGLVTPEQSKVTVSKIRDQASAFLNVVFKGHPAIGYTVTGYEIQPTSSVQLTGPPELVTQTKTVNVSVDVTDLRETKAFTVVPELKRGLQLSSDQLVPIVITVQIQRRHR